MATFAGRVINAINKADKGKEGTPPDTRVQVEKYDLGLWRMK